VIQPSIVLPFELVLSDGRRVATDWHSIQLPLLQDLLYEAMTEQDRNDVFAGANIFLYYSYQQAREVWEEVTQGIETRAFRGPDVFWVGGVDPDRERDAWIAWEEDGRLPDVIFETLSYSAAERDLSEKKKIYEQEFRTAEYFLFNPYTQILQGFRLADGAYRPIPPNRKGRLWSEQLGVFVGLWRGALKKKKRKGTWVRLFRPDGTLVPLAGEQAEAESQRAHAARHRADLERQRADAAEAEIARLRALLAERTPPESS
jgi:Uma2 family endonuclease